MEWAKKLRSSGRLTAGVVAAAVTLMLPGCPSMRKPRGRAAGVRPVQPVGVPTVRVMLTARAVGAAVVSTSGPYRLIVDGKVVHESLAGMAVTEVRRSGQTWQFASLRLAGSQVRMEAVGESLLQYGSLLYRGRFRLLPADGEAIRVVNDLDLESYLAGVLAKELYAGWSLETYRAAAVAARTFAMYQMSRRGPAHACDLGADTFSQVYGGYSAETAKSWQAVQSTRGIVLAHGQPPNERIFLTQYSSCCGGTVNGAAVLRTADDIEPLRGGQTCNDCDASPRYRWPAVKIAKADLHRALSKVYPAAARLGGVSEIRVTATTSYGRAIWVDVLGTRAGAKIRVRAEDIRLALLRGGVRGAAGLYSMNCRMRSAGTDIEFHDGRGFGHGVGLCQYGAQGKAAKGWSAEAILEFYYPGSQLFRVY